MNNSYSPPIATDSPRQTTDPFEEVVRIAKIQRHLILAVVANMGISSLLAEGGGGSTIWLRVVAAAAVAIFAMISAVRIAKILHGETWAIVCGVLMVLPLVNLITLLILSRGATKRLEREGIGVGYFGASADEVQRWVRAKSTERASGTT